MNFDTQDEETSLLDAKLVRKWALEAGLAESGMVVLPHIHETRDAERYKSWVKAGRAGTMGYLGRANEQGELVRARLATPFPWARTAIVCLASYHAAQPRSTDAASRDAGWIARYAWSSRVDANGERRPSDYHKVLLKRLRTLEARLREEYGEFESRAYVDTGPVVERALATAAGLGWTAKNTCLIHPKLGSYVFLAVLLTSLEAQPEHASWAGAGSLRNVPALPRSVSDGRAFCALPDGCDEVHLLSDHRTSRSNRAGVDGGHGPAGVWLRHLPGRVPMESESAGERGRQNWKPARNSSIPPLEGWRLWRSESFEQTSMAPRCGAPDSLACGAMSPLPWATAGSGASQTC